MRKPQYISLSLSFSVLLCRLPSSFLTLEQEGRSSVPEVLGPVRSTIESIANVFGTAPRSSQKGTRPSTLNRLLARESAAPLLKTSSRFSPVGFGGLGDGLNEGFVGFGRVENSEGFGGIEGLSAFSEFERCGVLRGCTCSGGFRKFGALEGFDGFERFDKSSKRVGKTQRRCMPSVTCIWSDFATIAKQAIVRIDLSLGCKMENMSFFGEHVNLQTSVAVCGDICGDNTSYRAIALQPKADWKLAHSHVEVKPSKTCSRRNFPAMANQTILHTDLAAKKRQLTNLLLQAFGREAERISASLPKA
jgi:hypothetical protein